MRSNLVEASRDDVALAGLDLRSLLNSMTELAFLAVLIANPDDAADRALGTSDQGDPEQRYQWALAFWESKGRWPTI